VVAVALVLLGLGAGSAQAESLTVNSRKDAGDLKPGNGRCDAKKKKRLQCTVRAAIEESNALRSKDKIKFDVRGPAAVKTIAPASELPEITDPVKINAYTQPGAKANTAPSGTNAVLRVELDGADLLAGGSGLEISAGDSVVRGLVINDFFTGLELRAGSANRVLGNFIGTDPSGTVGEGNNTGVSISGSSDNVIGGPSLAARNIVSASGTTGISIFGATGAPANSNRILGNLIGTSASGAGDLGTESSSGNGVRINGQDGATLNNQIGGTEPGAGNVIAFSGSFGVNVLKGTGNSVLSNSIFGSGLMGINIDGEGVAPNDDDDVDTGANNRQNYPVITDADSGFGTTTIDGTLSSAPTTTYTIQFFYNPASDEANHAIDLEEGRRFLGSTSTTTNASGDATFTGAFSSSGIGGGGGLDGGYATATATDPEGNTSEFSDGRIIDPPVIGGGRAAAGSMR
jgi:hypothetical protein